MIVLDASLAAKLVIEETDSLAAKRWFLELVDDVVAPDLIAIEVAQAIFRRINMRTAIPEHGRAVLGAWQALLNGGGISLTRTEPAEVVTGAEIAIRLGHPVKDCLYLHLQCDWIATCSPAMQSSRQRGERSMPGSNCSQTMPEDRAGLPILSFGDAAAWEAWLAAQPRTSSGLWLKLAKKGTGAACVGKAAAIDGALVHGWIDGQARPYDADWWLVRFTPRKARSRWSEINRTRALELIAAGRMAAAGLAEIERARADGRWDAAYAPASTATVPDDLAAAFEQNPAARAFFATLTGANRYAILYRIADAKRPETRARRIATFVAMCAAGETLH